MKERKLFIGVMAILLLMACSNDEVITSNTDGPLAQIQLSASMEAMSTRAADALQETAINTSSQPGVYVYRAGKTAIDGSYGYENIEVTAVSGTGGLTTSTMYYPQDKGSVDVYVYAPREATSPSMTVMPITVATDQSAATGYLASDFIYGKVSTVTFPTSFPSSAIGVTLKHALCKIKLVIEAGTGASAIAGTDVTNVTLGNTTTKPYLSATVNLTETSLSSAVSTVTSGTTGTVQFANSSTAQATVAAILPPQTLTNCPLSVTIGSATYTATLSSPDTTSPADGTPDSFEAGKEYTYTVKVNVEGLTISVTSITPWTSETGGTVNVY